MQTLTIETYRFSELDKDVQLQVLDRMSESRSNQYYDIGDAIDSLNSFCDAFNVKVQNVYGSYRVITSNIEDNVLELEGLRLRTYIINNYHSYLYSPRYNGMNRRRSRMFLEPSCPTGYCMDYALLEPIRQFITADGATWTKSRTLRCTDFRDLLRESVDQFERCVNDDYEYQCSHEAILESCELDDMIFLADGTEFRF